MRNHPCFLPRRGNGRIRSFLSGLFLAMLLYWAADLGGMRVEHAVLRYAQAASVPPQKVDCILSIDPMNQDLFEE